MNDLDDVTVLTVIIGLGVAGYLAYMFIRDATNSPENQDPTTGENNGILNGVNASIFGSGNPGGGAVAGTSETYTGAASEFVAHPFDSAKAILGW